MNRLHVARDVRLCISQLLTTRALIVTESVFSQQSSLLDLLGIPREETAIFGERTLSVAPSDDRLRGALRLSPEQPMLRVGHPVAVGGQPIAAKFYYFDGTRVRLVLSNGAASAIQLVSRDDVSVFA